MSLSIGYCTNVHAGATLQEMLENLERHARDVRREFAPNQTMGLGLWLSAAAAEQTLAEDRSAELAEYLRGEGFLPFTLNGFPFGNFHRDVVKHDVYLPTWWQEPRLRYTQQLIEILHAILPAGREGSISTLPIAWGTPRPSDGQQRQAARQLGEVAAALERLEQETGRLIYLCLEPEPGCLLQYSADVVDFFERYLSGPDAGTMRRYLRVCHDVCHAAVMFESQRDVIARYREAGLQIGKVQVSAAVVVRLDRAPPDERRSILEELSRFAEDRYLHQTMVRLADGEPRFFEDLPLALQAFSSATPPASEWRVHFHVPIYLQRFGKLDTSQSDILECLEATKQVPELQHYEVETYAWNVLPPALRQQRLAAGIAQEMSWFRALVKP
jgi:sugar phosphate isomerase/epimerase